MPTDISRNVGRHNKTSGKEWQWQKKCPLDYDLKMVPRSQTLAWDEKIAYLINNLIFASLVARRALRRRDYRGSIVIFVYNKQSDPRPPSPLRAVKGVLKNKLRLIQNATHRER